jgi:hypothetical protein
MVKLSRTSFGFLVFSGLAALAGLALAWGLAAGFLAPAFFTMTFLTVPLPAGALASDAFFGAGFAAVFTGDLGAAAGLAGVAGAEVFAVAFLRVAMD